MSKKSMKAPPILIVNMNIKYMTTRKMGMPKARLRMIRSMLSDAVCFSCVVLRTVAAVNPFTKS